VFKFKENTIKIVEKSISSEKTVEKTKTVQFTRSLWHRPIKNSENPKVQPINITNDKKEVEKPKIDICKLYQKPKLISSLDEYEEEENVDDSYGYNQKVLVTPSIKKLPLVESKKKKAPESDSEEEEEEEE
jgi:hypothetical protein